MAGGVRHRWRGGAGKAILGEASAWPGWRGLVGRAKARLARQSVARQEKVWPAWQVGYGRRGEPAQVQERRGWQGTLWTGQSDRGRAGVIWLVQAMARQGRLGRV